MPEALTLEYVDPASLQPYEGNPRKITRVGIEKLRRSIEHFGVVAPVIAQRGSRMIIAGHQRVKAATEAGVDHVPVVWVDMDDDTAKAYNIADNRLAEEAEWDLPLLDDLIAELEGKGIDTTVAGVDEEDAARASGKSELPKGADDVPTVDHGATISHTGDLWILGQHRLLCGDSTNRADVERLMDGKKAKLFATDPPYIVDYTGADRPDGGGKDWSEVYREVEIKDARAFWSATLSLGVSVTADDAAWYCWHAHRRVEDILAVWHDLGILCHQQIIWVKPTPTFGHSFWPWAHEPCLFGWREGGAPCPRRQGGRERHHRLARAVHSLERRTGRPARHGSRQ